MKISQRKVVPANIRFHKAGAVNRKVNSRSLRRKSMTHKAPNKFITSVIGL